MSKEKTATESELNILHSLVAKMLREQLESTMEVDIGDGETKEVSMATPAMFAQAIKFLKDNNITTTAETDDNLAELKDVLEHKQKRGSTNVLQMSGAKAASED